VRASLSGLQQDTSAAEDLFLFTLVTKTGLDSVLGIVRVSHHFIRSGGGLMNTMFPLGLFYAESISYQLGERNVKEVSA